MVTFHVHVASSEGHSEVVARLIVAEVEVDADISVGPYAQGNGTGSSGRAEAR
jgi:hypothetical protein